MAFTDSTSLRTYLGTSTGSSGDDALLTLLIARAQRFIEEWTGHKFETSSGVKYYREHDVMTLPVGSQWRPIGSNYGRYSWDVWPDQQLGRGVGNIGHTVLWLQDDLWSLTTLTNGEGTVITSTQYWLEPRNSTQGYQYIRLRTGYSWQFNTDGEISVDGAWGWSTTAPVDIVHACSRLAAYYYRQRASQVFDVTADPELGIITVPQGLPPDVVKILERYKKRVIV